MRDQHLTSRWLGMFPELLTLDEEHRAEMLAAVQVKRLSEGDVAYYHGQICEAYLMCIEGRTRVFKISESGREILLYQVGPGETCVLTTSCLMAGRSFPAESTAESDVILVALPAPVFHRLMKTSAEFRQFVMGNYGELLASLITLVEEVAFTNLDQRLARRLLAETDDEGIVSTTHQQLASDLGSVREVISRYLDEWERMGWVHASRGSIKVLDRSALSNYSNGREEYPSRPHRHHAG